MASVVDPTADIYWGAVGTVIDEKGITEITPTTTEEWDAARNAAIIVAETGNLLMMSSRAKDGGEWMKQARALVDVGQKAIRAAESHNRNAVFDTGAEMYDVCTSCHVKYALEIQEKAAEEAAAGAKEVSAAFVELLAVVVTWRRFAVAGTIVLMARRAGF